MSNADLADFAIIKQKGGFRPGATSWIGPAVAWVLALAIMASVVPKFEEIFRDFGIELSWVAWLVVRASHLWPAFAALVVALLLLDRPAREILSGREHGNAMTHVWSTLMVGLPLMTIAFLVIVLGTTLIDLMFRLSG